MIVASFRYPLCEDELSTDLWMAQTLGTSDDGILLRAYFAEPVDLTWLRKKYDFQVEQLEEAVAIAPDDESASEPVVVGTQFLVTDGRSCALDGSGRQVLAVRARTSFGSGKHESTQLVIEALESLDLREATVLDVGCGTAITAEAARRLGSRYVVGCDPEAGAMASARENFPAVARFQGSVDAVASRSVDVVIANISARVIDILAFELSRVCRDANSLLILAGFIEGQEPAAFRAGTSSQRGDWVCWISRPGDLVAWRAAPSLVQPFDREWW